MSETTMVLEREELEQIQTIVNSALQQYDDFGDDAFLRHSPVIARQMPSRLVTFLNEFKYAPPKQGYRVVKGYSVCDEALGPTPSHWQLETTNDTCKDAVMAMCLWSSVLGDIFGWLTQQDGRLVHDVLPIKEHESEQLGSGSEQELWMHTEDAFHELRGDYIMLMCLRNHDAIPTTLARPDYSKLTESQLDTLFQKTFRIRPDNSHKKQYESQARSAARHCQELRGVDDAYAKTDARDTNPAEVAVLFGSKENPYLCIDPYFMEIPKTSEARSALNALIDLIDEATFELPLDAGDCVVIDNYVTVHGRRQFQARYDGTDRWLKRLNIARDIRRRNHVLESATARVIY